jgi:ectoine hydroxylase-related dioxygenase (phytanoyl-CoA dioxygenase family)
MNVMLDDNNLDNGCLHVHKKLKGSPSELYKKYINDVKPFFKNKIIEKKSKAIIAKKGSVLIFDNLCPHYSKNSVSKNSRGNLYLTFCNSKNKNIYKTFNKDKKLLVKKIGKKEYHYRTRIG